VRVFKVVPGRAGSALLAERAALAAPRPTLSATLKSSAASAAVSATAPPAFRLAATAPPALSGGPALPSAAFAAALRLGLLALRPRSLASRGPAFLPGRGRPLRCAGLGLGNGWFLLRIRWRNTLAQLVDQSS
jgi:hypothetical protein